MSGKKEKSRNSYQVGYGKPPTHSRFRKGQSGNPAGKRRHGQADRARTLLLQEAYRSLTVREGDKVTRMPAIQAVLRSQIASAVKGNVAAQRVIIKAVQDMEPGAETSGPVTVKIMRFSDA
jgi:hypothetical protein